MQGETASIGLPIQQILRSWISERDAMLRVTISRLFLARLSCYRINRERKLMDITRRYNRCTIRMNSCNDMTSSTIYRVMEKWEYKFTQEMRENREMHNFLENHSMLSNPPREAFFGDRTEISQSDTKLRVWRKYVMWTCVISIYTYLYVRKQVLFR